MITISWWLFVLLLYFIFNAGILTTFAHLRLGPALLRLHREGVDGGQLMIASGFIAIAVLAIGALSLGRAFCNRFLPPETKRPHA